MWLEQAHGGAAFKVPNWLTSTLLSESESMNVPRSFFSACVSPAMLVLALCSPSCCQSVASNLQYLKTSFTTEEGYVFDATIFVPSATCRNDFGILMMGGGVGNDLNWTVPGFLSSGGRKQQITLSGEPHADAPRYAEALVKSGFAVMHFTTIRRGDPKRNAWPVEMTLYSPQELLGFCRAALAKFRAAGVCAGENVFLLGHSMGAARATQIAAVDDRIRGLILLAPAQVTRTAVMDSGRNMQRVAAREFLQTVDADGDQSCQPDEFQAWKQTAKPQDHPLANQTFAVLDFHPDRRLTEWEISAGYARAARSHIDLQNVPPLDRFGLPWPEDILRVKQLDTLVIFGSLDNAQAHHAPILAELIKTEHLPHLQLQTLPAVGHQLGPEQNGLIGPVSEEVVQLILKWLGAHLN